jgi:hypothetical protein
VLAGLPFATLDRDVPLLLLPVRLETRFDLTADPPTLRIRVYPDQIHVDTDSGGPSTTERELAVAFWRGWHAAGSEAGQRASWQTLVDRVGTKRARHLSRVLEPTVAKDGALTFPSPPASSGRGPARPVLLPRQWLALGYVGGVQVFREASAPVARDLRIGADPTAPTTEVTGGGLTVDEGLAWMLDYARAEQVGMAITVKLAGAAAAARDRLDVLLVLGLDHELAPDAAAAELARLLEVHSHTTGLDFVPQGTPTNNTESVTSGWTPQESEPPELAAARARGPAKEPRGEPDDNAARLAAALGLADPATLRRLAHGTHRESAESRDMRAALFEAVMGTLIRELLDVGGANAVSLEVMDAVRRWFVDHVTGGAAVPVVRVGPQPYGILPVRRSVAEPDPMTPAGQVERIVRLLIDVWRRSADGLPTLDSNQVDPGGDGEAESAIASIVAMQPHPARLLLRTFEPYVSGVTPFSPQPLYQELVMKALAPTPYQQGITEAGLHYQSVMDEEYPGGMASIDDQIDVWTRVSERLVSQHTGDTRETGLAFVRSVLGILGGYEERQRPLRWLGLDRFAGVLNLESTRLIGGLLHGAAAEWGSEGLVQSTDATDATGTTAAEYLADLRARFAARNGTLPASTLSETLSPRPLLYQLLDATLHLVPRQPDAERRVQKSLEALEAIDPGRLEWLLRETLGLGAHRLDAWATSLATERLDRLRATRPRGLQIGAFGWVIDLEPRRQRRPSEGFIHAPSMAHATTAALLRAGWQAHGSDAAGSPLAVDLRSDRVRTASWLLDGVRQGQLLGDLLGYRFERSLHDRGADGQIRPVRQRVLAAAGRPDAAPSRPVDGIALLDLYRHRRDSLGPVDGAVSGALEELEAAFDAVSDVALFESVHQLAAGNHERATAMLEAMSLGTIAPPELRGTRTPRSAVSVEHRVVLLFPPTAPAPGRGWSAGIRDTVAPALEAWVASLLPPAGAVGLTAVELLPDGQTGAPVALTLADLGLSALDAIYLVGDDPHAVPPSLRTLAAGAAGTTGMVQIDPTLVTKAGASLADFALLAGELRRLLEGLRPADARDLRPASAGGEPDTDPSAALDAVQALIRDFDALADRLDDGIDDGVTAAMAEAVSRYARLGLGTGAAPTDVAGAVALQGLVTRRMANVYRVPVDRNDRQPGLEKRLAALLGHRVPVLGRFTVAGHAAGPVVDVTAEVADPLEVDDWLDAVGRVRTDIGRLGTVGLLSELLGEAGLSLHAGQSPVAPGERWAATTRPPRGGRLSIVAVSGPGVPPGPGQPACGLVVDRWSEAVPATEQVSGVTFQFDAPGNRPPQAWLLAVTPDGEPWSLKLVTDTLLETLEWSRLRAVGPEDLVDYGRSIPTTFVPGPILRWPGGS